MTARIQDICHVWWRGQPCSLVITRQGEKNHIYMFQLLTILSALRFADTVGLLRLYSTGYLAVKRDVMSSTEVGNKLILRRLRTVQGNFSFNDNSL